MFMPGVDGLIPPTNYRPYKPLSSKTQVKLVNGPFQGDGRNGGNDGNGGSKGDTVTKKGAAVTKGNTVTKSDGSNNQSPFKKANFDPSKYKGGPQPFKDYVYEEDTSIVARNIGFNDPKRLNKSYVKHAKHCFGTTDNRNKKTLEVFKSNVTALAQLADTVYTGSFRYADPAYIFVKEINEKATAVVVNATDLEYITSVNPTEPQIDNLELNKNIGLDTRPPMPRTSRVKDPKITEIDNTQDNN